MKKILGSLLLLSLSLWAKSTYEWSVSLKDKQVYLHQATTLSMQCRFDKMGKNDDVEFTPPKESGFDFKLLSEDRRFEGERQTITYQYLLFAKEAGRFDIKLEPKMLFTTQSAIDNVIIGRDNVNDLETEKEIAKIDPISIDVLETGLPLTGQLSLHIKNDIQLASAYEPVHLEIAIKGEGNLQALQDLEFDIEGVEVFSDEAEKDFVLSTKGYTGTWTQRFAFVAKEDFEIPSVSVAYFDPVLKQKRELKSEAIKIQIDTGGIKAEDLIDKVNLPSQKIDFSAYLEYLYYLLTFISGFVVAKLLRLPKRFKQKKEKGVRIKQAKTAKELLSALMSCDKNLFSTEIEMLEAAVYKGDKIVLSKIKKSAYSKL